jgi:hypothetical protein
LIDELQQRALEQHYDYFGSNNPTTNTHDDDDDDNDNDDTDSSFYTATIVRHADVGLGMTLYEDNRTIQVHSLTTTRDRTQLMGPSYHAGIQPGDVIIGVNGQAFRQSIAPKMPLLQHAVHIIHLSPDPIVLHLQKQRQQKQQQKQHSKAKSNEQPVGSPAFATMTTPTRIKKPVATTPLSFPSVERSTSLLDATTDTPNDELEPNDEQQEPKQELAPSSSSSSPSARIRYHPPPPPYTHNFAKALRARGLLHSQDGE